MLSVSSAAQIRIFEHLNIRKISLRIIVESRNYSINLEQVGTALFARLKLR